MNKLLIVDDDKGALNLLKIYLTKENFHVDIAENGKTGLEMFERAAYDVIILDIMMPEMNGIETLLAIRKKSDVPVIFVTAKDGQQEKIQGFIIGCDDYITKPVDLMELKLRIETIIRRAYPKESRTGVIQIDNLIIDEKEHRVTKDESEISLTSTEFNILLLLAKHRGQVFYVRHIYESVWQEEFFENDRSVLTHIGNLREKLGDVVKNSRYIKTIWGVGYKIEK